LINPLSHSTPIVLGVSQGTADLAMRFGLNSGPTTAGVIRGDKSRFQLFGDVSNLVAMKMKHERYVSHLYCQTVNTAARMESNGERNRIQVSQKTADLIQASGRG
jgi:class 3 adenylate cyclase